MLQLQNDSSCGTVLLNVLRFVHTYHLHPRLRNLIHTKRLRHKRYVTLMGKIGMQAILNITVLSKRTKVPSVNVKAIVTESFGVNRAYTLMDRMGSEPNLSVKRSVTIGTMISFDGDSDGDGDGTCKRPFNITTCNFNDIHAQELVHQYNPCSRASNLTQLKSTLIEIARVISHQPKTNSKRKFSLTLPPLNINSTLDFLEMSSGSDFVWGFRFLSV